MFWTYEQSFYGRTVWGAMVVRPKNLWKSVNGVNEKCEKHDENEQFLNGDEREALPMAGNEDAQAFFSLTFWRFQGLKP